MDENTGFGICGECRQPSIHKCEECGIECCHGCEEQEHWVKCATCDVCYPDAGKAFLKSTRDLQRGEIIFKEAPLVFGPKVVPEAGQVPCVGCCRPVASENVCLCPECSWPACSPQCPDLTNMKTHGLECKILKLQLVKDFRFEILLPLRLLSFQTMKDVEWKNLLKQMGENSEDLSNPDLEFLEENYLLQLKKIEEETTTTILEEKSKTILLKIFNHVKSSTIESPDAQIFYPKTSLIQHSCLPNSFATITKDEITIRANTAISRNSPITISRTDLFQGTHQRLANLKTKNTTCFCSRCSDPTEFGTFFTALRCLGTTKEPCGGNQLAVNPTDPETLWVCDQCKIELPNDQMMKFITHLGKEVAKVLTKAATIDDLEEFLAKLFMFLHPNHVYVCQIKHALVKLYTDNEVNTKIEICESLIEIARKLYPNGGLLLAELLHELFEAKLKKGSQDVAILVDEMKKNLEAVFDIKFREVIAGDEDKLKQL